MTGDVYLSLLRGGCVMCAFIGDDTLEVHYMAHDEEVSNYTHRPLSPVFIRNIVSKCAKVIKYFYYIGVISVLLSFYSIPGRIRRSTHRRIVYRIRPCSSLKSSSMR